MRKLQLVLDSTNSVDRNVRLLSNATGLIPQKCGLQFPPVGPEDLPMLLKPQPEGGILEHSGTVEIAGK